MNGQFRSKKNENAPMESQPSFQTSTSLLYAWLIFLVAITFNAYDAYLRVTPSVTGEQLRAALGIEAKSLGTLMTFYFVPYVLLQIPVGLMVDRMGARWLLSLAVILSAIGSFLFGAALSLPIAFFARLLIGIGGAFPGVGPIYLASRWFPPHYVGTLAGLTGTSTVVGAIGGETVLASLLDIMDWRTASYIAGGVGLVIAVLIFFIVRDAPTQSKVKFQKKVLSTGERSFASLLPLLKNVLVFPQNWVNSLWGSLMLMPILAFASLWAPPFFTATYGVETKIAATAASAAFIGLAFGGPLAGLLSERLRSRRKPMLLFSCIALLDSLAILYIPGLPFSAMYPLMFLLGFCLGSQGSLVFAVAVEINDRRASGVAIGFTQSVSNLGGAIFPPLIGFLLTLPADPDRSSVNASSAYQLADYHVALSVLPIGLALAMFMAYLLRESYGMQQEQA